MLVSLFTPTHKPKHLLETYHSLQFQGNVPWEWVVVPNGACTPDQLPIEIQQDKRVRIVPYPAEGKIGIGSLKLFACQQSLGDLFIELDHDDLLVPQTLGKVVDLAKQGADFIYSDAAYFLPDRGNAPHTFDERYGWETYDFNVFGRSYLAHRSFDITARSLCQIYYAPDHLRCWTRQAYYSAGGHDPRLTIGDDHELLIRTYLNKARFSYTGNCGYLYRSYRENTHKQEQRQLVVQHEKNYTDYVYKLVDEWCRRHTYTFLRVDLRVDSGKYGFVGKELKIHAEDASIGCVQAYDVLQYLEPQAVPAFMNELYRVLLPGGWACLAVPSTDGRGAWLPQYRSYWNDYAFVFFCEEDHAQHMTRQLGPVNCRFQPVRVRTDYPDGPLPCGLGNYRRAGVPYVYADLCALKGQRQPGLVEI